MSPTQTNQIDWAALDALLCERLGIAEIRTGCKCGHSHPKNMPVGWICGSRGNGELCPCKSYEEVKVYPALSTTGDGMLILVEAMAKQQWRLNLHTNWRERVTWAKFLRSGWSAENFGYDQATSIPGAVAKAAAAALGILLPKVPEKEAVNG